MYVTYYMSVKDTFSVADIVCIRRQRYHHMFYYYMHNYGIHAYMYTHPIVT